MAGIRLLDIHKDWEDCLSVVLGALIIATSWFANDVGSQSAALNATLVGLLVLILAGAEFVDPRRWEEGWEAACGAWLIVSPFVFGYADAGMLRFWHFVLGTAVVLLSALELRQDWELSDAELAHHGAR